MHIYGTLKHRLRRDQAGFTLVEVLVVTIIIGILAAIALAVLIGEREKAHDSKAKSDVSGLIAEMESCQIDDDDFGLCDTQAELKIGDPKIDTTITPVANSCDDPGPGVVPEVETVAVVASDDHCYVVKGTSKADDGGSNHIFIAARATSGARSRTCEPAAIHGLGGCPSAGTW